MAELFRLVKYYNLPRYLYIYIASPKQIETLEAWKDEVFVFSIYLILETLFHLVGYCWDI